MQQLTTRVIILPEPSPKLDEFCLRLAEFIKRDDLLLMGKGQVVRYEVIEEEGDLLNIRWDILNVFLLQLLEVIRKLLNHGIPLLSLPRPPPAFTPKVQPYHLLKPSKPPYFLYLPILPILTILLTGFWIDEVCDDSFIFLLFNLAILNSPFGC